MPLTAYLTLLLAGTALAWPPQPPTWNNFPSSSSAGPNHGLPPCSPQIYALATGIHLNIQGQYSEYNGSVAILALESANPVNHTAFLIAKGELLSDIQAGMNLRQFNQEIAPAGNAALAGLAKYAAAEVTEQNLALGLVGVLEQDRRALEGLKSDVLAGIMLNEMNLVNATQSCDFQLVFPAADQSA
ncbi:hypothetical protein LTR62_004279 [Meristemomyces frigidus]|uniref:Uncharacterized protein n=1 Tax=Meristemomyces frigidus TaxID=1508187 RepID=A0AAN7TIG6_9PEZI|nr:hypothetical protein LTR62_004279 [Meristemomyces frigidus]